MESNNRQAILAIISRTRQEVATTQRRMEMYQQVGETPPDTLVDQLETDTDYLDYLKTMVMQ
jgi:hypothetical protein